MHLMCDAVSVLGAKHGILVNPNGRYCRLVRFDRYEELPVFGIRAGIVVNGREIILPLSKDGDVFGFCDQRMTPCTVSLMGVDPASMIKLKLTLTTPFRPKDAFFSTVPVIHIRLELEQLQGGFRWDKREFYLDECEFFFEITGSPFRMKKAGQDSLDLEFTAVDRIRSKTGKKNGPFFEYDRFQVPQTDRLAVLNGNMDEKNRISLKANLKKENRAAIDVAWCTHSFATVEVKGERHPYRYTKNFRNLDSVEEWVRKNPGALPDNARKVDGIIGRNNLGRSINRMFAYTLHSWLMNTVWIDRGGKECFTVWEGNCYYQSTVDVEYSQAPFYLSVWPELLKYEIELWTEFSRDGGKLTGAEEGRTLFVSHDVGGYSQMNGQDYPHDMEVEETANFILLSYLYWRRTGDFSLILGKMLFIEKYLEFLQACDSTGNGVPDRGVANTVDDGNPAMQFGKEQVYLAVKALAAYEAAADIFDQVGIGEKSAHYKKLAGKIRRTIESRGWMKDHYAVLLDKSGMGVVHPWTKEVLNMKVLPGWDSEHVFTENAMAMMDLVGKDLGLDQKRVLTDLNTSLKKCLAEYGCRHSSHSGKIENWDIDGFIFNAYDSSWISSNIVRDIAALYRGIDTRSLVERYWDWQTTVNTREEKMYFESFNGNNVAYYPRGTAVWGYFDALGGIVIDQVKGIDRAGGKIPQVMVPRLETADWKKGICEVVQTNLVFHEKKRTTRKRKTRRKREK